MIIKKPYAFLIKHFRLIHLILFSGIIFIAYKSTRLMNFFNDYVKNGFYTYVNDLTSSFINIYTFLVVIGIVLIGVTIYILLRWKDKKRTLYVCLCSFYLVLLVVFMVYFVALNTIQSVALDVRSIRLYRDVIIIFTIPQYFFVCLSLIRAIGFDIKKFNFSKDIQELKIEDLDSEEVEITFGKESYKYKRKARKTIREFKYYILENKFFFLMASLLILVVLVFSIYLNKEVFNKTYRENASFTVDGVNFNVLKSYYSDIDYKAESIVDGKAYISVLLNMRNNSDVKKILKTDDIRLVSGDSEYIPKFSVQNYFIDLAEGYNGQTLYPGEEYVYLLTFEVPKEEPEKTYTFRLINTIDYLKGEINARHKDVKLVPEKMLHNNMVNNYKLGDFLDFGVSTLENSSLVVMSYDIKDSFTVKYEYCVSNNCYDAKKIIKPSIVGKIPQVVMKLDVDYGVNDELYAYKYIEKASDFINMFGFLKYKIDNNEKVVRLNSINYDFIKENELYLEIPKEIEKATEVTLAINVRHINYSIKLK